MDRDESLKFAVKVVEDIISFFEVKPEVGVYLEEDVINIDVSSTEENSLLIGRNAETLRSIQTLVSGMLHANDAELRRVSIDIAGYKKQHAEKIAEKAEGWIKQVRETGDSYTVHLNAADRRTVHRVAQNYSDIRTHSEGEGRDRVLIISQKSS